jgi:hypothetical protein
MTIINEITLDGTPLAAPGVWYTANIAESSFVDDVKIRINETGPAEVKFTLDSGREYVYRVKDEFAADVWADLSGGFSPGAVFGYVKNESRYTPVNYKPARQPEPEILYANLYVVGPADKIAALQAHAEFMGLTV